MRVGAVQRLVKPNARQVLGKVVLEPSGDHRIKLHLDGSPLEFDMSAHEARRAIELLERGIAEITFEDGRPSDRLYRAVKGIE